MVGEASSRVVNGGVKRGVRGWGSVWADTWQANTRRAGAARASCVWRQGGGEIAARPKDRCGAVRRIARHTPWPQN